VGEALAHPEPPRAATLHRARVEAGPANTGPGCNIGYRSTPQLLPQCHLTLPRRPYARLQERDAWHDPAHDGRPQDGKGM
jgi:hypothetical protein